MSNPLEMGIGLHTRGEEREIGTREDGEPRRYSSRRRQTPKHTWHLHVCVCACVFRLLLLLLLLSSVLCAADVEPLERFLVFLPSSPPPPTRSETLSTSIYPEWDRNPPNIRPHGRGSGGSGGTYCSRLEPPPTVRFPPHLTRFHTSGRPQRTSETRPSCLPAAVQTDSGLCLSVQFTSLPSSAFRRKPRPGLLPPVSGGAGGNAPYGSQRAA